MFKQLKDELLSNPQSIINVLETYEFYKPKIHNNEIRFGLHENCNPTAIRIKLINNDNLYVKDFVRGLNCDLIQYIIKIRKVEFIDVLKSIKNELNIIDFNNFYSKKSVFGGFYDKIKNRNADFYSRIYNDEILNQYQNIYNTRFLKDNISFNAQDFFKIGYDVESQRITIPVFNSYGEIIGIKGRANWEVEENEVKYLYLIACAVSTTLYGYCHNYEYITNNDILIFEAEKSVLQCYSYGIRNCVAIGCNSLSPQQCKLIMKLNPKRIIFMLDKGLDIENTNINIEKIKSYMRMSDASILYWDWKLDDEFDNKASPSDLGKEKLLYVINNQLKAVDDV